MLLDTLQKYKIYLVSQSPRRKELLSGMGIDFEILKAHVEEIYPATLSPEEVVKYLSRLKLSPLDLKKYPEKTLFIACDTIVVANRHIIGKPRDAGEAMNMLHTLSGHTHTVLSGLTVATPREQFTDYRASEVTFAQLSDEELHYYIDHYKPFDKAGAYGVQEWIGYVGIRSIHGSVYNVMGLPTHLLWDLLGRLTK